VIAAVTVITVFTDLATAVCYGVIIAALNFAWQHARQLYSDSHVVDDQKYYAVHGTLFFASTTRFLNQFDPANDPDHINLDCSHLMFVDYSAIAALTTLRERYTKAGKHLRVTHLSDRCKKLLKRANARHE
jgi:SulP family sulfate permease